MKVGIVGAEESKWTKEQKKIAKEKILDIIRWHQAHIVDDEIIVDNDFALVSGHSPKGGVDIWVEEIAREMKVRMIIYPPKKFQWEPDGYKQRNILIAENSDTLYVFSPKGVWNGGLWTANYAESLGKPVNRIEI